MIETTHREEAIKGLVTRAARGDDSAFEQLFRSHYRHVFAFCRMRVSHTQDAEDCAQETFSRAWWALRRGAEPDNFRPWLFTIAARLCTTRRAERATLVLGADLDRASAPFEDGVVDRVDATIPTALARLAPTDRSIVEMTHSDGMPIGSVARKLGLPLRHVEGSLFRTRRALRAELEPPSSPARTRLLRC